MRPASHALAWLLCAACGSPATAPEEPAPSNESVQAAAPRGLCAQLRTVIDDIVSDDRPDEQIAGVGPCAPEGSVYRCSVLHPTWAAAGPAFDGLLRQIEPCLTGGEWKSEVLTTYDSQMLWRFQGVNETVRVTLIVHGTADTSAIELALEIEREPEPERER